MKSSIFWDITSCSPLRVNRRFGGICRLRRRLTFNNLYGVVSQKIELFIYESIFKAPAVTLESFPDRLWGPPSLLSIGYWGPFPRRESGSGVKPTTHLNLVLTSRKLHGIVPN
jgi:hypothetical protein